MITPSCRHFAAASRLPPGGSTLTHSLTHAHTHSHSAALARLPLEKFLEQPVAFARWQRSSLLAAAGEEIVELIALALRHAAALAQPLLGAFEALPTRQNRRQIGLAPFRMARRLLEFGEPREEVLDELLDATVTIRALRPVERDQPRAHRHCLHLLPRRDETRIVVAGQHGWQIVRLQRLVESDAQEAEAVRGFQLRGRSGRLAGDQDRGSDLASLEGFEGIRLTHVHFLGFDAEFLEDVAR